MVSKPNPRCKGKVAGLSARTVASSRAESIRVQGLSGVGDVLRLAEIAPVVVIGAKRGNSLSLTCKTQVGRNNGKDAIPRTSSEEAGDEITWMPQNARG